MKRMAVLLIILIAAINTEAQFNLSTRSGNRGSSPSQTGKVYFGCGGGFGTGTDASGYGYTYFSLLPVVGYKIDDNVSIGASFTYQLYSYKGTPNGNYSFTQYGVGPYVRYTIDQVFFQAEYDLINAPTYGGVNNNEVIRSNYSRFLVGIGYILPLGQHSKVNAMAMYDLLYKTPSVFASPYVVRVFFVI